MTVLPSGPSRLTVWPARPASPLSCVPSALRSLNTVPLIVLGAYSPAFTVELLPEVTVTGSLLGVENVSPDFPMNCTVSVPGVTPVKL